MSLIAADIASGRRFILLKSDRLEALGTAHGFILERADGRWREVRGAAEDLRQVLTLRGRLLACTAEKILAYPRGREGEGDARVVLDDVHYIHRMIVYGGGLAVLTGNGRVLWIEGEGLDRITDFSAGIEASTVLTDVWIDPIGACVVGMDGGLWLRPAGASRWERTDIGTNAHLTGVARHRGQLYVCGFDGLLFRGDGDTWTALENPAEGYDLWAVVEFRDRLFVAADFGVLAVTEEGPPTVVVARPAGKGIFHGFAVGADVLWALGEKKLLQFADGEWTDVLDLDR